VRIRDEVDLLRSMGTPVMVDEFRTAVGVVTLVRTVVTMGRTVVTTVRVIGTIVRSVMGPMVRKVLMKKMRRRFEDMWTT